MKVNFVVLYLYLEFYTNSTNMFKKILLLFATAAAFYSCSEDSGTNNPAAPAPLPDTCLLSGFNTGIPASSVYLIYDSNTYLPISVTIGTSTKSTYTYNGNTYRLVTQPAQRTDTLSKIIVTVDSDKKAVSLMSKVISGNIFVFSNQTLSYNANKTLAGISTVSYNQNALGGPFYDSSYREEKIYWTNGNLTLDSVFVITDKGTAQETKALSLIRKWEFSTQPDIKGVSELLINTTYIPKLFGVRSKNLPNKIIDQQPTGASTEIIVSYLLNASKWPTNVTLSGAQSGGAKYIYTCYKRK